MAQIGLFPLPEVKWDPQKKRWQSPTSPQQHDAVQERHVLQGKEPGELQIKRRRRRRTKQEMIQERLAQKGSEKLKTADGGRNQLVVLENSAQLLLESGNSCHSANGYQTQGKINETAPRIHFGASNLKVQKPMVRPLKVTQGIQNLLDVTVFPMQRRIRVSQLRHQARLKHHQSAEQLPELNNLQMVVANQVEEVTGRQDVEEILAMCYSQMVEGRDKDQVHEELNLRNAAGTGTGLAQENVCKEQRIAQSNTNYSDQATEEQIYETTEVSEQAGEKISFVEGRIRLSELKREARSRNTKLLERSHS